MHYERYVIIYGVSELKNRLRFFPRIFHIELYTNDDRHQKHTFQQKSTPNLKFSLKNINGNSFQGEAFPQDTEKNRIFLAKTFPKVIVFIIRRLKTIFSVEQNMVHISKGDINRKVQWLFRHI